MLILSSLRHHFILAWLFQTNWSFCWNRLNRMFKKICIRYEWNERKRLENENTLHANQKFKKEIGCFSINSLSTKISMEIPDIEYINKIYFKFHHYHICNSLINTQIDNKPRIHYFVFDCTWLFIMNISLTNSRYTIQLL